MSKKRMVAKYTTLGVITSAYTLAVARAFRPQQTKERRGVTAQPVQRPFDPKRVAIAGATMLALTWAAGLL